MTKVRTHLYTPIHTDLRKLCEAVNTKSNRNWLGMETVLQLERLRDTPEAELFQVPDSAKGENDWVLTERWVNWDRGGEVMGATRIIASTAHVSHAELHNVARSWMWGQGYLMDWGPNHCDTGTNKGCDQHRADDDFYSKVMIPEWRRRYLPSTSES